ncbi:AraC-like DNA-binding protein [Pacificibacter maritimus]|uniref:AraC-like DNA-binding protein n=1 Tax=Pacificibacter maritimus TaxID=762213 RepID=A0A3N4UB20_9RHOB|nr:AraC family transcriptional regulator [Pacificibacter maritimus]RPE66988.1 AraC-like DNA-binding protein [Pacificibacter maritimus]
MTSSSFFNAVDTKKRSGQEIRFNEWDEVKEWAKEHVAPIDLIPLSRSHEPHGVLNSMKVGRIGFTCTKYGQPLLIHVEGNSAAPVVATTNLCGHTIPELDGKEARLNPTGNSFVFDLSDRDHRSQLSKDNVQLQLSFCPRLLDEVSQSWFGNAPHRKTWQFKTSFGGSGSSWHSCLDYVTRLIAESPQPMSSRNIRHIEETLAANLLGSWAAQAGVDLNADHHLVVPHMVRQAEEYIIEHAADAPTLAEVANTLGISVRNLSMNFKKFRGCTLGQFLKEQRLQAARRELRAGGQGRTVGQIAASLSYIHMGEFAKAYRERFGERPSDTLKRSH